MVGAWALATWDVFLDPQMIDAGHWTWADPTPALPGVAGVPLSNFGGWLLVSAILIAALDAVLPGGDGRSADHGVRDGGDVRDRGSVSDGGVRDRGVRDRGGASDGGVRERDGVGDGVPAALYVWTYCSSVLAAAAFFGRPTVALVGGVLMGVVAVPFAVTLWRGRRAIHPPRPSRAIVPAPTAPTAP